MNYTTREVAFVFRVKVETIREWLRTGKIHGTRIGKSYLVPQEEILTLLRQKNEQFYKTS